MRFSPKAKVFVYSAEFALAAFGAYLALTFFEIWAYFPYWVKNAALVVSLGSVYFFGRRAGKTIWESATAPSASKNKLFPRFRSGVLHAAGFTSLVFVVWGGLYAGPGLPGRLVQAFTFSLSQPPASILLTVDATSPAYTGEAPRTLFDGTDGPFSRYESGETIILPEGTILDVSIAMEGDIPPTVSLGGQWARADFVSESVYRTKLVVIEDATLDIEAGPYVSIQQRITVIPDENPAVAFFGAPELTGRETVSLTLDISDDHGVDNVFLDIEETGGDRFDRFELPLSRTVGETSLQTTAYVNFLDHPLAGSQVRLTATAVDGVGQEANSESVLFRLPEKTFTNEIAIDVISIRKSLLLNPDRTSPQVNRLDRLTRDASKFDGNLGVYLGLRSAYWRLRSSANQKDIDEVTRFLWQTALQLENDGAMEEQRVRNLLIDMTEDLLAGEDYRVFEKKTDLLKRRLNALLRLEFQKTSRRVSLNTGVSRFETPALKSLRDLIETARLETREGQFDKALDLLLEASALFEEMSF